MVVLPVLVPLATAALALLAWNHRRLQRGIAVSGSALHLLSGLLLLLRVDRDGIQALHIGGWPAPFGITFAADLLGAIMATVAALIGLAVSVYSVQAVDRQRESHGYHPLFQILLMGVSGAFLTGDLFNLYVWFEVMLIASFVLLALGGERAQMEGAIKYVVLNLVSSTLFVSAVGLLYGTYGALNMAELSLRLGRAGDPTLVTVLACLFLVSFGIKAAIFPLFAWLPASYHTPPVAVTALLAGLLTKVGVYALIRVFTLLFLQQTGITHTLILWLSGLTMVTGVLGAAVHKDVKRILSFHIVSQVGYMVMGLGLFTPLALAGSVFYLMHHIVVKSNLFLVAGVMERLKGSSHLERLGSLWKEQPLLGLVFLVSALSLAGLPPLSGFFAKLILVKAGLEASAWTIVATALGVSLLTLYSMTKIWGEAFWKEAPAAAPAAAPLPRLMAAPAVALSLVTVGIGLGIGPLFGLAQRAAAQLMNPAAYVQAVLGPRP